MASARKLGAQNSKTRDALIKATTQVMIDEGYAAVTTRRVAAEAGVNPALVYYYFATMDELFLEVFRRGAEANLERQRQSLSAERPLHALWEVSTGPFGAKLLMEFMALANHRKDIRVEIARYIERFREIQQAAFTFLLRAQGVNVDDMPPVLLSIMLGSFASILVNEQTLGIELGHAELTAFVERLIAGLEPPTPNSERT
ncbi:TetR/AcrR family transcriptional regulator [Nocardia sp. NPDC051750]|uniref:TetR/AcrR family transcriptional regulator n=1 Tax=Nocardia sp. NPDC051750 TaxID=3364325 RepID=UPI0037B62FEA